jgi:hypothetical protein
MKKRETREAPHYATFPTLLLLFCLLFSSATPLIVLLLTPKFYAVPFCARPNFRYWRIHKNCQNNSVLRANAPKCVTNLSVDELKSITALMMNLEELLLRLYILCFCYSDTFLVKRPCE